MKPPVIPSLPENAPFTPQQRAWLNGFLAGVFNGSLTAAGAMEPNAESRKPLLILFGSQTGSAEALAKTFSKLAESRGFAPRLLPLNDYEKGGLATATRLVVITSTWGDGDPPDNAAACWAWLNSDAAPRLEQLAFAVLALGDRNYADFCGAGKKFDGRLESLGARRLVPRGECDVDYEAAAQEWIASLWLALEGSDSVSNVSLTDEPVAGVESATPPAESPVADRLVAYSRTNPFPARLKTNRRLNRAGSAKETRHFEIALDGSGLDYEPGDALAVTPANCPVLVEALLAALGFKGEEPVKDAHGKESSLHEALLRTYDITQPNPALVQAVAARTKNSELSALLATPGASENWLRGRDVVDVLRAAPGARFAPAEFTGLLRKLQPRLYSISSSPRAHPGEVHLTVGTVRYEAHGRARKGVCSTFLADRVALNETPVPVFIRTSPGFRLPADGSKPVVMAGPGTGIAPFRAFLEERRATGARGRNWVFFGDQHRALDFLYEEELTALRDDGWLTRLDVAFSRDQAGKCYVQDRMREQAAELWRWLEEGAHFYVCGDARRMAKDVDAALNEVIEKAGGRTAEQAAEYVAGLKAGKRYQRDVY